MGALAELGGWVWAFRGNRGGAERALEHTGARHFFFFRHRLRGTAHTTRNTRGCTRRTRERADDPHLHALGRVGEDQVGAESLEEDASFERHGGGHGEREFVPLCAETSTLVHCTIHRFLRLVRRSIRLIRRSIRLVRRSIRLIRRSIRLVH